MEPRLWKFRTWFCAIALTNSRVLLVACRGNFGRSAWHVQNECYTVNIEMKFANLTIIDVPWKRAVLIEINQTSNFAPARSIVTGVATTVSPTVGA
jgi:hypothetical protein